MLIKLLQWMLSIALLASMASILVISSGYIILKPNLPEINLVNENALQVPLKVFSKDEVLIGEFGEQKRRTIEFQDIPLNVKNAFLAAEDDKFFEHRGIRILSFARAFFQLLQSGEIVSGGGTITMQVVRGYLLSRDQKILRKIKEIYLAFELESIASKEEIFSLYLNTIFLGNRAYGVEAAADKYFAKSIDELSLAEAALLASSAQLPSRINPIRSPERSTVRRNWILGRMYKLDYIGKAQYLLAIEEPISIAKVDSLFDLDGRYIAELARQNVISRYGLSAYTDGLSVFTTIQSQLQKTAISSLQKNLFDYDKRHGWRKPSNYYDQLDPQIFEQLALGNLGVLQKGYAELDALGMKQSLISILREIFDQSANLDTHIKAIVVDIKPERIIYLDNDFTLQTLIWSQDNQWARRRITINSFGPKPQNFYDILKIGDLINLEDTLPDRILDQLPEAEAAFIASNPLTGAILAYQGGFNFSKSNFDRVKQSFPQAGSSFKPFIYSAAIANGYKASDTINDAPIIFEDQNLESAWRPENYTGKFYGPIRLREALVQSVNIVSIKLLRELGIDKTHTFLENFGFPKSRLAPDLSLALGSSSFSPAEMIRAYTQSKYISAGRATGRIARTLDSFLPDKIETIKITNLNAASAMSSIEIPRAAIARYESGNNTDLLKREVKINEQTFRRDKYKYQPDSLLPKNLSKITPSIRSQVGGPDGFYFGELAIAYHSELIIRKDLTLSTVATIGIIDNFEDLKLASDSVLPHVRTDIVQYLKNSRKGHIRHSSLTWFQQPYKNIYTKLTGGILEEMFSGVGGEFLYRESFSNFGIGAELW
ncbi:transglycosylase domain-containing protein, partial [Pseudomonadota bacterium]|nr:transglycosylase domain-containing protein [Pseudomonadota bacterium]